MAESSSCAGNIGPREQRKRLLTGLVVLAAVLAAGVAMVVTELGRWWLLVLFLPAWFASLCIFEAQRKT